MPSSRGPNPPVPGNFQNAPGGRGPAGKMPGRMVPFAGQQLPVPLVQPAIRRPAPSPTLHSHGPIQAKSRPSPLVDRTQPVRVSSTPPRAAAQQSIQPKPRPAAPPVYRPQPAQTAQAQTATPRPAIAPARQLIQRSSLLLSNSFAALAGPVKGSGKGGGGGDEKKGGGDEKKGGGDEKKAPAKSAPKETELQRKGRTWEGYYDNAIHQMNGHGADAMNHNVDQQSVLNHLPAVGAGNHYYAVRAAPGDNQIRIFLEVDASNNVVAGGQVLIGRCLTHQQSRDAGAFWVYRRTGLRTWVHHSGTQPY